MKSVPPKVLLLVFALAGMTGCDGDRGCFGLCDKKDDDDAPTGPTIDRSCYRDSTLNDSESLSYTLTNSLPVQLLSFESSVSASETALRPILIWITGDTWSSNNSVDDVPGVARSISRELGSHLAVVQYRSGGSTVWPEPIQDVKTAIRFLKTQATDLNIDTDKLFLGGDQAGAHLAALAGLSGGIQEFEGDDHLEQSSRVSAIVALGGVFDFDTLVRDSQDIETRCGTVPSIAIEPVKDLFSCPDAISGDDPLAECDANTLEQASPSFHVSSDDPALLAWHGAQDCAVPSNQSVAFSDLLDSRSVEFSFTLFENDDDQLDSLRANDVEEALAELVTCND